MLPLIFQQIVSIQKKSKIFLKISNKNIVTSVPYPRAYSPSTIKGNMISFYGGKLVNDTGDVKAFGDMWNLNIDILYSLIKVENTDISETVTESK